MSSTPPRGRLPKAITDSPRALKLLMAVAFVHAIAWAVVIAPLTGPDEANHAAAIQHIAETGHGVTAAGGSGNYSTQMDTLFTAGGLRQMNSNLGARPSLEGWDAIADAADKQNTKNGSGPNPIATNPPLYYYAAAVVYRLSPDKSLTARLFFIRVVTALSMPLLVLLAWLIGTELFASMWPRVLMGTLVALQPKLAFMCGIVNPDALLIVFSTLTLLLALKVVKRGPTPLLMACIGLSSGAALLTHGRGVGVVLVAGLAALIGICRHVEWRTRITGVLAFAAPLFVLVLAAFAYTRAHNSVGAFGGQVTQATAAGFSLPGYLESIWQFYLPRPGFMTPRAGADVGFRQIYIESFFGQQGGLEISFSHRTYSALHLAASIGLLMLAGTAIYRWRALWARWREVTIVAGAFILMILALHFSDYRARIGGADVLITGRYLLPAIGAYAATIAFVLNSLPRRIGATLGGILIGSNIVLALGALGLAVERLNG